MRSQTGSGIGRYPGSALVKILERHKNSLYKQRSLLRYAARLSCCSSYRCFWRRQIRYPIVISPAAMAQLAFSI